MMDNSCEHARELMAGAWMNDLNAASVAELHTHLAGCSACAAEMEALGGMWEKLGDLPVPEPSLALRVRWEQTLSSLFAAQSQRQPVRRVAWWRNIWPANPAWQMAIAGLCLMVGLGAGTYLPHGTPDHGPSERDEVAKLREEVASTKEMIAVSLLQQQSAADRLRGVDYTTRMGTMEPQVVTALIQAVNRDSSVNVRLAAIDALGKVANESQVRQSMQEALPLEDSPMVQAAMIDYLVEAHDRNAIGTMRDLVARPGVNATVRERAGYAVKELNQ